MIGVFDSGFGGLTILRELARLPARPDLIYFGDNARAPYGGRPGPEIVEFTRQGTEQLLDLGCKIVIIACNTASAVALRHLQKNWLPSRSCSKVNVLGIIVPTIERTTGQLWREREPKSATLAPHDIAVFATLRTVETRVYPIEIAKRRPDLRVHQEACPGLASAIEAGASRERLRSIVGEHVAALLTRMSHRPSQAILGCTHYSLLADLFSEALGPEVQIIDQAGAVAQSLSMYLERHPEYGVQPGRGEIQFFTSGYTREALNIAEVFWGSSLDFQRREPLTHNAIR